MTPAQREQIRITGPMDETHRTVLTEAAVEFLVKLARAFEGRRQELLARRRARQQDLDRGVMPDFLPGTAGIREGDWRVADRLRDQLGAQELDRAVEICEQMMTSPEFPEFLTLVAYSYID